MPDLLTHALAAYSLGIVCSWRVEWLDTPYVTAMMVGAFVPDLVKVKLLVPSAEIGATLGIPFSWLPLHTLTGVLLSVLLLAGLVADPRTRRQVLLTSGGGALSHLMLDALLRTPTGRGGPVFWPITEYQPPTPGLYLSTEPWPTALFLGVAVLVVVADRRLSAS
jgi:hypothetical protein